MKAIRHTSVRSLTYKYIVALSIIALLSLAAFFTLRQLIISERASAGTINVSGRQRMYAQKGVLLSLELTITPVPAERRRLRSDLQELLKNMDEAHRAVISGNGVFGLHGGLSPQMQAIMYEKPVELEAKLHRYYAAVNALMALEDSQLTVYLPQLGVIVASADEFITAEDIAVGRLQAESENRVRALEVLETIVLILTLLVLTLEGLLIFRPSARAIAYEQAQLAAANDELKRLSNQDGLTGVANRRFFDGFLARLWRQAGGNSAQLSLLLADIDNFKYYNDTYGHQLGDECLRKVAKILQEQVGRESDLVARYGGEEFVVILPFTGAGGAAIVAEKIRGAVENAGIEHKTSVHGIVTISLGVATMLIQSEGKPEKLIEWADKALYQAKEMGRNRIVVYQQDHRIDLEGKQ